MPRWTDASEALASDAWGLEAAERAALRLWEEQRREVFTLAGQTSQECKGVHGLDLGESFQTHIYLQNLASIQPKTSPLKFAGQRYLALRRGGAHGARKFGCSAEVVRTPTPAEEGLLTGMYMEGLAGDYKTPDTMFISTPS